MDQFLQMHLESLLMNYTQGDFRETLLDAKAKYFAITGPVDEDGEEYEAAMNCFNDWYVFHYISDKIGTPIVKDYLSKQPLQEDLANSFQCIKYSLFEFLKVNFKKQMVLKDLVSREKVILSDDYKNVPFMTRDLFTARVINYNNKNYLLKGICLFPKDVRSLFLKQIKKVKKLKNPQSEMAFLSQIEALKAKWLRFGQLDVHKIFKFES